MGIFFKKNNKAEEEQILVEQSDVVALMQSQRWSNLGDELAGFEGLGHEREVLLKELLLRPELQSQDIDVETLMHLSADDIIERFLRTSHSRIVAQEGEPTEEIVTEADVEEDDEMVSEELAEVYLAQGLNDMAKETYRKLSLLNPEKSVYFAGLIEKIEKNN